MAHKNKPMAERRAVDPAITNSRTTVGDARQSVIAENVHNTGGINFEYHSHETSSRDVSQIINWLSQLTPLSFANKQVENIWTARKTPGTGQWLLDKDEFCRWRDDEDLRTLWCHGIPGAGKTILCSVVIDHLERERRDNGTTACLYVYFDNRDHSRQDVNNLLPCLLAQMVRQRDKASKAVHQLHQTSRHNGIPPTADDCLDVLASEIRKLHRVYVVVDALDECQDDAELNTRDEFVRDLQGLPEDITRLLFFSRYDESIKSLVNPDDKISIAANERELASYVKSRIDRRRQLKNLVDKKDEEMRLAAGTTAKPNATVLEPNITTPFLDQVVNKVVERFLLARLHMDFLASKLTIQEFEAGLKTLPRTPDEVYKLALQRIASQNPARHALAIATLRWLVFAKRALTMQELLDALAVDTTESNDNTDLQTPKGPVAEDVLTSVCAGLLVVDTVNQAVSLAHYTTRTYIETHSSSIFKPFGDSQGILAEACLRYLLSPDFLVPQVPTTPSGEKTEEMEPKHPFRNYAADYWGRHMAVVSGDKQRQKTIHKLAQDFLYKPAAVTHAFQAMTDYRFRSERGICPLHVAAYFGLERLTWRLTRRGADPDAVTIWGQSALHWATLYGHSAVIKALIANDANPNITDNKGQTPLLQAVMGEDTACIDALLLSSNKIRPDIQDNQQWTPLRWAAARGRLSIVQALLKYGADINAKDRDGFTALQWANKLGHGRVAELLIDHGASLGDVSSQLFYASRHGQLRLVRRIVEMTSLPSSSGTIRRNSTSGSRRPHLRCGGVDLNVVDQQGWTALRMAVEYGHGMVTWFLIQAGADVNKADEKGLAPLHAAAAAGATTAANPHTTSFAPSSSSSKTKPDDSSSSIPWLLLQCGADPLQRTKLGWTPLHFACYSVPGNSNLVWLLLQHAPTAISLQTKHGETPLHLACRAGHLSTASLLLARGSDPLREVVTNGATTLHVAVEAGQVEVVRLLLSHDGNITPKLLRARDDEHATPLHYAASPSSSPPPLSTSSFNNAFSSSASLAKPETEKASHPAVIAIDMIKLLTDTARSTSTTVLKEMINIRDTYGNTPLHRAASTEQGDIIRHLIKELGADPNALNRKRQTPLHVAAGTGNLSVVKVFLDFNRGTGDAESTGAEGKGTSGKGTNQATEENSNSKAGLLGGQLGVPVVDTNIRDKTGKTAWEVLTELGCVVEF